MYIEKQDWKQAITGWVFLSHSSLDIDSVKIVRNYLEEYQFNTIMFFLKCFENENDQNSEIENLLRCEIKSRNIFIFCKSKNSEKSKWVSWERDVAQYNNKISLEINIDNLNHHKCIELSKIDILLRYSTLYFIFYSSKNCIVNELEKKLDGFKILRNSDDLKKEKGVNKIRKAINETKNKGFVVLFVSRDSLKKKEFWSEKQMVLEEDVRLIVVLLDNLSIDEFSALKEYYNIEFIDNDINQLYQNIYIYVKNQFLKALQDYNKKINNLYGKTQS